MPKITFHQLALRTPGIFPSRAIFLKHSRQSMNFRYTARERPQTAQRVYARTLNFGFALLLITQHFLAIEFVAPDRAA